MNTMARPSTPRGGRPRKEEKISLSIRIRKTVNLQFRRFVGPDRILNEVVERALVNEMKRSGKRSAGGTA